MTKEIYHTDVRLMLGLKMQCEWDAYETVTKNKTIFGNVENETCHIVNTLESSV